MTARTARVIARILWVFAVGFGVAALVFLAFVEPASMGWAGFFLLTSSAYATVGVLIASRHPQNPIGWLFLAVAGCFGLTSFASNYASFEGGRLAWSGLAGALTVVVPGLVLPFALPTFLLLFPEGGLLSRRWRLAVGTAALAAVVLTLGLLASPTMARLVDTPAWVAAIPGVGGFVAVGAALTALATATGFASLVIRYRRAAADDRQHVKWLTTMLALMVVSSAIGLAASLAGPDPAWLLVVLAILVDGFGVLIGIPAATAIAVLTFGLYDVGFVVKKTIVYGLLVATFALCIGLLLFLLSPLALGTTGEGAIGRFVTSAALVVLVFAATFGWLKRIARRAVFGRRATPYEVMAEFTERLGDAYSTEDVLPRTAEILRASTGADIARVWLRLGDQLRPAASSPSEAPPAATQGLPPDGELPPLRGRSFPVRHQGDLLGAFTVEMPVSEPLSPTSERLAADLATQAGLVLRNVRLTEELKATIEELRASRQRIVSSQDERARKLERDLHDGAQQQLVALAVKLSLAARTADEETRMMLSQLQADANDALQNLRDLARGIYPPLLADKGLESALGAQAGKAPVPVTLEAEGVGRYAQEVEAAVYFCCLEALQNIGKYASATRATIRLRQSNGVVVFSISDDGAGFDSATALPGTGLTNMRDRLEALGGALEITSEPGAGTTLAGRVPTGGPS